VFSGGRCRPPFSITTDDSARIASRWHLAAERFPPGPTGIARRGTPPPCDHTQPSLRHEKWRICALSPWLLRHSSDPILPRSRHHPVAPTDGNKPQ
jgi:hypothetical protein